MNGSLGSIMVWALLLVACRAADGQDLVLNWPIAYSGTSAGQTGWHLNDGGWPAFIERHVKPALRWCEQSGVKPAILIHHPWGQFTADGEAMTIDAIDQARAAGARFLLDDFASANGWKLITKDVPCYGYFGGVDLTPRLRKLSAADRAALIARNLKPLADAGFRGIYLDAAENAIQQPYHGVTKEQSAVVSVDLLTLAIADDMFPERAGIEAAPRAFPQFKHLWDRNIVVEDKVWLHRFGPDRHRDWKALGYVRSVLTGKVWRTLPYRDDTRATVAAAKAIVRDNCTPCVSPQPLISAGVAARELVK